MATLCELKVTGKTNGTVVVATRILDGKVSRMIPFKSTSQIEGAITAEKAGIIKIEGQVPEHILEKMSDKAKERFPNQTFGKAAESNPEAQPEMPTPSNKKEDMEPEASTGSDTTDVEMPVISNEKEDMDSTDGESGDSTVATFDVPSVDPEDEAAKGLSRQDIIDMTAKQLKAYIKDNNLDVTGVSNLNARQLTEEVLKHFGYDELKEDEKN